MSIEELKIEIAKKIFDLNDQHVLEEVEAVLNQSNHQNWEELPSFVKDGINRGLKHVEEDKLTPHQVVMQKYQKFL